MDREPMWSYRDIAEYAGVHQRTIRRWLDEDKVKHCGTTKKGKVRTLLFSRSKVMRLLKDRKTK